MRSDFQTVTRELIIENVRAQIKSDGNSSNVNLNNNINSADYSVKKSLTS